MSNLTSKNSFIEKLRFHLSFYFCDDENISILNDYEEWFENETLQGKTEEEICAALEDPKKIVKNLLAESSGSSIRLSALFHNTIIQVLLLMVMHSFILSRICNENALNYLYFAVSINFLYFLMGMLMIKKTCRPKLHNHKMNLLILGFSLLLILFEIFFLPKQTYPNAGKICVTAAGILSFIFFAINIYFAIKKLIQDKQYEFLTIFHRSGIITLLLYLINQSHSLHNDMLEFHRTLVLGSICIYAEIVVLCVIFYKSKIHAKE